MSTNTAVYLHMDKLNQELQSHKDHLKKLDASLKIIQQENKSLREELFFLRKSLVSFLDILLTKNKSDVQKTVNLQHSLLSDDSSSN